MKRLISLAMILVPALTYAASSITFESDTHDFGKVAEGDRLEYTFHFSNTGTDELNIERVTAS